MGLISLHINNQAGGLIYHRASHCPGPATPCICTTPGAHCCRSVSLPQDFSTTAAKLDVNDHLRLASTFSGLALIMQQLSPVAGSSSMQILEALQ